MGEPMAGTSRKVVPASRAHIRNLKQLSPLVDSICQRKLRFI
jgi:hypothetical protein